MWCNAVIIMRPHANKSTFKIENMVGSIVSGMVTASVV